MHVDVLGQADNGELATSVEGVPDSRLMFYRPDYVLISGPTGTPTPARGDSMCDRDGCVGWLRVHGCLYRRQTG